MGKLEDAIKALKQYEKHQTHGDYLQVVMTSGEVAVAIKEWTDLYNKFNVRQQAEKLGWLVVEDVGGVK